jgi:fucose 4-O-acetylase-like acetyltransferase
LTTSAKRIVWIDIARGLGILLVVYSHALRGLLHSGILSENSLLAGSDYVVTTFRMPMFFFLAGLNVPRSLRKGPKIFAINKLWTLYYAYLLWSYLQGGIQYFFQAHLNSARNLDELIRIPWQPMGQFWFLYCLLFCHAAALLSKGRLKGLVPVSIVAFLLYGVTPLWFGYPFLNTEYMFIFYVAGIYLHRYDLSFPLRWKIFLPAVGGTAALFTVAVTWGRTASRDIPFSYQSLPACILGITIIFALSHLLSERTTLLRNIFSTLGKASMTIYVLHVITGSAARVVLKEMGVRNVTLLMIVVTVVGLYVPLLAQNIFARMHLLVALGLASPQIPKPKTSPIVAEELE